MGKDSDLVVIDTICQYYGIRSIVAYTMAGPYVRGYYSSNQLLQGAVTSNPNLISPRKYLQILQTSLAETINLLGYDYMQDMVGYTKIHDYMIN